MGAAVFLVHLYWLGGSCYWVLLYLLYTSAGWEDHFIGCCCICCTLVLVGRIILMGAAVFVVH